ncbi:MAG TPA: ATP-binding cassette domain-containing protein [Anaerolineae bacterium]|jgi:putative ABC transport system ATP-binding protein|nr:ATP-binding cassette domain-containing protein [Anaerolineae bacterium]
MSILEIKSISCAYNGEIIFNNLSLSVDYGDLAIISGPSGSGKSSFLRHLNRLQDPASGTILFGGRPLTNYKAVELRRQIVYLQQTPLIVEGTVRHNLVLPFSFRSLRDVPTPSDEGLRDLLHQLALTDVALSDDATTLSVGQKQRLAFIRAMLVKPKVLLLDEPTSALDEESRTIVEERIESLAIEKNVAVVMVTHLNFNPQHVKAKKYVLSNGGLVQRHR